MFYAEKTSKIIWQRAIRLALTLPSNIRNISSSLRAMLIIDELAIWEKMIV